MSVQRSRSDDAWDPSQCERTDHCPPRCPRFLDDSGRVVLIRNAGPNDHDALIEMYESFDQSDRAQGLPPSSRHRLESWLETILAEGTNGVATVDDRVVGHCVYTPATDPEPELAVFVQPADHGRGIGTELCKRIVATGVATDKDAIVLEVERRNRVAVHIYRQLGFETLVDGRELHMRLPLEDRSVAAFQRRPAE